MKAAVSRGWRFVASMPFTACFAFMCGALLVLSSPGFIGPLLSAWDEVFPVIHPVQAEFIDRNGDEVILNVVAEKHRGEECTLIRLYGYGINRQGVYSAATVRRPDGSPQMGIVHGKGVHNLGLWRVKPIDGQAVRVQVFAEHNCLGRVIKSMLAEVAL